MAILKRVVQKLITFDGIIQLLFTLLVISIPMQYRFFKLLRPFKNLVCGDGVGRPMFFENMLFYCISDIFILALVIALLYKKSLSFKSFFTQQSSKYLSLYFFIALVSLILSKQSGYILQYVRWWQLFWVGVLFYIISQGLIGVTARSLVRQFLGWTVVSAVFQCGVATLQYFTQHAVGLKKLGEINIGAPGLNPSSFSMYDGSLWLIDHLFSAGSPATIFRAYGTLPDPNILGGYLVLSLLSSFSLYMVAKKALYKNLLSLAIGAQFFSLFITYSRSAYIAIMLGSAVFFFLGLLRRYIENRKGRGEDSLQEGYDLTRFKSLALVILTSFSLCMALFYSQLLQRGGYVNYKNTLAQGADSERIVYQEIAVNSVQKNLLTGVGFNNYVLEMKEYSNPDLPDHYSHPVHNVFLLIASETGLLGLLSFYMFIFGSAWAMFKRGLTHEVVVLASILIAFLFIGCCGHYFLSWQHGKLMFFMTLGLIGLVGREEASVVFALKGTTSKVTI